MNYLAHGWRLAHEPYVLAGTAVPDWLNVIDRRMKVRSKTAALFVEHEDPATAAIARGIVQHHRDDAWFHDSPAFTRLSAEFSRQLAAVLPGDEGFRPWFLGHILVELLLDAALIEEDPQRPEDYYAALAAVDPAVTQTAVNAIATKTTDRLTVLLPRFLAERFLYDYLDDGKLLTRLNAVMRRVGLPQLPGEITVLFTEMRNQVRQARDHLLPDEQRAK
jgi:hypothetical protein